MFLLLVITVVRITSITLPPRIMEVGMVRRRIEVVVMVRISVRASMIPPRIRVPTTPRTVVTTPIRPPTTPRIPMIRPMVSSMIHLI